MYDLIRKLTCNRLDGVQGEVSITKDTESKRSTEAYLKKKSKKDKKLKKSKGGDQDEKAARKERKRLRKLQRE